MRIKVLGCSGGIGGDHRTTSFLVDDDILIDAGTGVGSLSWEELARIDHVFLTHAHLDHIAAVPLMIDSTTGTRTKPLTVYAVGSVIHLLREHIFNWHIWPDFTRIPSTESPALCYQTITVGSPVQLGNRVITPVIAEHTVPAVGYHLDSGAGSLVYTGDSICNPAFWDYVNAVDNLRYLFIETAFSEQEKEIARRSKHLCPSTLSEELTNYRKHGQVCITHLKPGKDTVIMQEIEERIPLLHPQRLCNGDVFEF